METDREVHDMETEVRDRYVTSLARRAVLPWSYN